MRSGSQNPPHWAGIYSWCTPTTLSGLGDDAFVKDLDLHVLVGEHAVSVELHDDRYPEPLTQEEILQKEEDAAGRAIGRLQTT
jgi:hypothetical protein